MSITQYAYDNADELKINIDRLEYLDQVLTKWTEENKTPSIAARILRFGKEIFYGAYGISGPDKEKGSMKKDMIFPVSSLTKPVVATLMCILQEDGIIDLCDSLQRYLPEFTGEGKESVLLWQLLAHCSGITGDAVWNYIKETAPDASYKEQFLIGMKAPLKNKPRTEMSYCSVGYDYCGEVIRRVTGKTLDEYAYEKIFKPLSMNDSYWVVPIEKRDRIIRRHPDYLGASWYNSEECFVNESGGGGLKTTAYDITNFLEMIRNNGRLGKARILSPASVREMSTDHNKGLTSIYKGVEQGSSWGLGFNIRSDKKDDMGILRSPISLEHGGAGGVKTVTDPQYGVTFAHFTVDVKESRPLFSRFTNIIYSALD